MLAVMQCDGVWRRGCLLIEVGLWVRVHFPEHPLFFIILRPYEYHRYIKTGKGNFSLDQNVVASSCPLQAMEGTRIMQG